MTSKTNVASRFAVASLGLLLLSGCASGPSAEAAAEDSAAVATAQKILDTATAKVTDAGVPASSPGIAKNKLIVAIPCAYAAAGCARGADATVEAAKFLGWEARIIDPAGDPEKMRQAVNTAVQLGADGIVLTAVLPDQVKAEVAAARAAGVKVINTQEPAPEGFADANVLADRSMQGKWSAAYLTVATKGVGKIIAINDPSYPSIIEEHQGFGDGLKELCPRCEVVKEINTQLPNLQTLLPQEFQASLQANPAADAVWAAYDPIASAVSPVIERSANADQMTMVSHNGDDFALDDIKKGKPLKATAAHPVEWMSYIAVDQLNRLFAGNLPGDMVTRYAPSKLMTAESITGSPWDGDVDWKGAYQKMWGAAK